MTRIRVLMICVVAVACDDPAPVARCLELDEVRRYGALEAVPAAEMPANTDAVIGDARGVVAAPNDNLYVLDRRWQKIVVFRPDGTVERVIRGGEGEGPGEFRLPMHLAETERGVSVLDYQLRRAAEFDWSGQLLRTMQLQGVNPWAHLIRGDTAWITYNGVTTGAAFTAIAFGGNAPIAGPPLETSDQPFGTAMGASFGANGEILVNTRRPGVWMAYENGSWTRRGTTLFPDDAPILTEQTGPQQWRETPSQHTAGGIAVIGDSIVLQGFGWYPRPFDWDNPPRRDQYRNALGIFRRDGKHLATIDLSASVSASHLSTERKSGRIFLSTTDPFPQVVEYRLAQCVESAAGIGKGAR